VFHDLKNVKIATKSYNIYNNLAKPFITVGADPFYGQTSGPKPPNWLRKINSQKIFEKIFTDFQNKKKIHENAKSSGAFGESYEFKSRFEKKLVE
jgi:hypothetical protein